jgi:hypothetical protein
MVLSIFCYTLVTCPDLRSFCSWKKKSWELSFGARQCVSVSFALNLPSTLRNIIKTLTTHFVKDMERPQRWEVSNLAKSYSSIVFEDLHISPQHRYIYIWAFFTFKYFIVKPLGEPYTICNIRTLGSSADFSRVESYKTYTAVRVLSIQFFLSMIKYTGTVYFSAVFVPAV